MRILRTLTLPLALLVVAVTAVAPRSHAASERLWSPPLGHPLRISAPYSLPNGPYRAGHRGIDLPATSGDPVRAPTSGTISFAGTVVDRPVISIRVDERTVLSMEPVTSALAAGDIVAPGGIVGEIDSDAHCAGGCLHLGVRVDGDYVNPLRFLRPRPVLLPW
ncbi:M23 family metallopeptidase [Leucobacter weissii]|uniref:M23 family metallopeptidase n=1 Tax=Leucobacter weissii TaxID=1983706 RepID=A0A939MJ30_9MICO|nr:M23 family metallopeptidase [Leucobacter weissii]MBO1901175.1 M23 family metallopeptidase [Leucobacter weissii]